jgi:large subunit ribosomal protein L5
LSEKQAKPAKGDKPKADTKADKQAKAPKGGKAAEPAAKPAKQSVRSAPRPKRPAPEGVNPMTMPRIEKVTVNIGVGDGGEKLEKAEKLLQKLTGLKPRRTFGKVNNRELGVRPGMPIGCKATLRGQNAEDFVRRALYTRHNRIHDWSFDNQGNLQFGVADHTTFQGERYDPEIGVYGMDVCITLEKPGHRIKRRRAYARKVPMRHRVTRDEAKEFLSKAFEIEVI